MVKTVVRSLDQAKLWTMSLERVANMKPIVIDVTKMRRSAAVSSRACTALGWM